MKNHYRDNEEIQLDELSLPVKTIVKIMFIGHIAQWMFLVAFALDVKGIF